MSNSFLIPFLLCAIMQGSWVPGESLLCFPVTDLRRGQDDSDLRECSP